MLRFLLKLLYPLRDHIGPLRTVLPRLWNWHSPHYLVADLSLEQFAVRLNERHVDYVVLNRGDNQGESIELLVRGGTDMESLDDLVTDWPVGRPIRIYTVAPRRQTYYYSPLAETDICNRIAVFPPYISVQLLERAVSDGNGMKELTASDAFLACAYRAAYMEACCDWQNVSSKCDSCNANEARLRPLALAADVPLPEPLTPQSLDQLLNAQGWRPPLDLLEKAASWSPWIRSAFPQLECEDEESRTPGLAVFFLREVAFQNGWKSEILTTLTENGFKLLLVKDLNQESRERAERCFRGGDWGAADSRDGGPPACVIIGLDLLPRPVSAKAGADQSSDNIHIRTAKLAARKLIKTSVPKDEAYNPLHTTDNSRQAWTTIRLLLPEHEQDLRARVAECRRAFKMKGVVGNCTFYGGRARAEVIHFNGSEAIRKVFPASAMRHMQREIEVMEDLGPLCPELPKLLERGPNFIVVEQVDQDISTPKWPRPLPYWAVRQLSAFIKKCVAHGFDPIGLKPRQHVILTSSGIRVVAFDFWRHCDRTTPPKKCYALAGLPQEDRGDRPTGLPIGPKVWAKHWFPDTALSLDSFLYDPPWLQLIKRAGNLLPRYARWQAQQLGRHLLPLGRGFRQRVVPKKLRPLLRGTSWR